MSIPPSLDGFDVAEAVARMLDQPALWWQAVGLFVDHFSDWETEWQASIGDDALERKLVHALRSAAANVGAYSVVDKAGALEDRLLVRLAGGPGEVPGVLRQGVQREFRRAWQVAADARQKDIRGDKA
jgi:HPt (histidine-containing phosphotransfer) domain-containing protein